MRHYVSCRGLGDTRSDPDEIILSVYGPRGGAKSLVGLAPLEARRLRDQLSEALMAIATEGLEP